ncbi:MAG: hypothetical protein RLZZ501_675 [Pseudomonadota bacterium]
MHPQPLSISFDRAVLAALRGDHRQAVWLMRHLLAERPGTEQDLSLISMKSVQLALLQALNSGRGEIFRECPLLGRAGEALTDKQRGVITAVLRCHEEAWAEGQTPPPRRADVHAPAAAGPVGIDPARTVVAFLLSRHIICNPDFIESDFFFHMPRSAAAFGFATAVFPADEILYDHTVSLDKPAPVRPLAAALDDLARFLAESRPDIVCIDGNFKPGAATITPDHLCELRRRFGFRVVVVIPDCYDARYNYVGAWAPAADLFVTFHDLTRHLLGRENCLSVPCLPFAESAFHPGAEKTAGVNCLGSPWRDRHVWLAALLAAGVPVDAMFHDRRRCNALSSEEYLARMGRAKFVFSNGTVAEGESILTGRTFEAILSECLLFYEVGSPIDDFMVPFVHYVPVANIDQLITFSRFFLEREDLRRRIAAAGRRYFLERYGSGLFWRHVAARLGA